jgi:hypothetical protein
MPTSATPLAEHLPNLKHI